MNQLKKLFTIILFACFIIAADKSYKITSTDIKSFIKQDGTIDFIEKREFDFTGSFTYVYQDIPKKGFDQIYDIQVSANDVPFINSDTKEAGTFIIQEKNNYYRIYLYHKSQDEKKLFTVKYSLRQPFTIGPNDSQFYWIYLSDEWYKKPGSLAITQTFLSPISEEDITYQLERPSSSKEYTLNINGRTLSFRSDDFSGNTEMRLRTIFPSSYFDNVEITDKNFSLAKLEEQKRNKELVQYFIGFLALFSMVSFISYYRRNLKKFKLNIDQNQQFNSFPSDHHPVVINGLIYRELTLGPTGGGILATLFELASLKKLSIEVIEKGKWFKSKRLKVTVHNTDMDDIQNSFAKLLLTRLRKFGKNTTFKDVFHDFQMCSSEWKALKKEELTYNNLLDMSGSDEKFRLSIIQLLIMGVIITFSIIFKTFMGFISILPFTLFLIVLLSSRLTKEGQLLFNQWGLFYSQLSENKVDVSHFDADLLLQYCLALGIQPKSLESVIKRIEDENDSAFIWMYHQGESSSGTSSMASIISDIATTGTTISASYGGDGGAGGGAGGGGGGGAG
ncbi:MAG: DUF2207 domain-containing protein [Candidatus Marinimicrobia bacterium]|nr:DUF2207 domain-containing protein [Candidatus Neomarinimicrobiota bacterium]MDA1363809.1 DUF2207 domain-containing protein [Candidatus Neomarinimicrobiota bacterium]